MAKRWTIDRGYVEVPDQVEKFMAAYARLCQRYGLCFSHEDHQGAFIVVPIDEETLAWANDAMVDPRVAAGLIRD